MNNNSVSVPLISFLKKNLPTASIQEPANDSNPKIPYYFKIRKNQLIVSLALYQDLANPYFDIEVYYNDGIYPTKLSLPKDIYDYIYFMLADTLIEYWKTKRLKREMIEKEKLDRLNNILETNGY